MLSGCPPRNAGGESGLTLSGTARILRSVLNWIWAGLFLIAFVVAALLLGLGTKCYRDTHPQSVEMGKKPARKIQR